ncbi:transcriptional regulator [Paucimonas lemoignei]|uniref:Transcriptional regulator n=1 Tax=Paucimonas lemoignei TaxID=29443 RepID=A0A4R3HZP7_PAULE|nr:ABC-type transport auxiliary lipoprotein family protein [Paucimonas lemoignei]TCS37831.1 transcriptional regulator [Paucimonas lemoignei]
MKNTPGSRRFTWPFHRSIRALWICCVLLAAGCSVQSSRVATANFYDLGPLPGSTTSAATPQPSLPAIAVSVADVTPAVWLDSQLMFYRLLYADAQQTRAYAQPRWVMQPAALFTQRLKARIVQAGGVAASAIDGPTNLLQLRMEADDFTHVFESPDKSFGNVAVRVSLYNGRTLITQKSFTARAPAPSSDAQGGARALAAASDIVITDMLNWLAGQTLKR